jgi:hypothetical protein
VLLATYQDVRQDEQHVSALLGALYVFTFTVIGGGSYFLAQSCGGLKELSCGSLPDALILAGPLVSWAILTFILLLASSTELRHHYLLEVEKELSAHGRRDANVLPVPSYHLASRAVWREGIAQLLWLIISLATVGAQLGYVGLTLVLANDELAAIVAIAVHGFVVACLMFGYVTRVVRGDHFWEVVRSKVCATDTV